MSAMVLSGCTTHDIVQFVKPRSLYNLIVPNQSSQSGCLGFIFKLFGISPQVSSAKTLPYRKKDWLFSKAERSFFGVLEQAVAAEHRIFAKIRLCDVLWLPKGTTERQGHQNRINSKHIDFVICTRDEIRPILAIELDDSSHDRDDRKARDVFVDAAFKAAALPLLHVPAKAAYNVNELRRQIDAAIGRRRWQRGNE